MHRKHSFPLLLTAIFLLLAKSSASYALDISLGFLSPSDTNSSKVLIMKGEIKEGDYEKLLSMYNLNPTRFQALTLVLASEGGDISEAIKIGNLIKRSYQPVFVNPEIGKCASACFLIYIAAVERGAYAESVGIHRPYFTSPYFKDKSVSNIEVQQKEIYNKTKKYLEAMDTPQYLIEKMLSLSSTEIYWLTDTDLAAIGNRPNWYDQLLVDRCQLNKSLENGYRSEGNNFKYAAEAITNLKSVFECAYIFSSDEGVKNIKSLATNRK